MGPGPQDHPAPFQGHPHTLDSQTSAQSFPWCQMEIPVSPNCHPGSHTHSSTRRDTMSGSTCARLSAPTSPMQLLYKLPETEVTTGFGVQGCGAQGNLHRTGMTTLVSKGKLRPRELKPLHHGDTVSPGKQQDRKAVAARLRLHEFKS